MKRKLFVISTIVAILLLCIGCTTALADNGAFHGMDWDLTNGVLTLGKADETQTLDTTDVSLASASVWPWYSSRSSITSITMAGPVKVIGDTIRMFYYCSNLTNADVSTFDMTDVGSTAYMFYYCSNLERIDLSQWSLASVTNMNCMFYECRALQAIDFGENLHTDNLTEMSSMFLNDRGLLSIDLSAFDLSHVTSMSQLFYNCSSLTQVDMSGLDLSAVRSMASMFYNCSSLVAVDFENTIVSSVRNVAGMFQNCSSLEYLDISGFDFSNVVYSCSDVYANCSSLTSFTFGEHNPVACSGSLYIPLPVGWSYLLENSDPMVGPYTSEELVTEYSADLAGRWVCYDSVYSGYAVHDEDSQTLYFIRMPSADYVASDEVQTVTSMNGASATGIVYPANTAKSRANNAWGHLAPSIEHVVALDSLTLRDGSHDWFMGMSNCVDMDLQRLDMSVIENCSSMFQNCASLEELDLSGWTLAKASSMSSMWYNCSSLKKLYIPDITFARRPSVSSMFYGCSALEELDISGFDGDSYNYSYQIDYSPLTSLVRIRIGMYPGPGSVFGAPQTWISEDGLYGPYSAVSFANDYGYYSSSSPEENKAKAGWYVRASDEGVIAAIYCYNDSSLYFFRTTDCYGDKVGNTTIHRSADGQAYTGLAYWMPVETTSQTIAPPWASQKSYIRDVIVLDAFEPANHSMYYWFENCQNIRTMDLRLLDVSHVTNMHDAFYRMWASGVVNLRDWKLDGDPDISYLFYGARAGTLDLTGWDVSKVTRSHSDGGMFQQFNGHLIAPDFHWDSVVALDINDSSDFGYTFGNSGNERYTILDIPRWSFGQVANLNYIFYYSYADINAPDWNLDGVITMDNICRGSNRSDKNQVVNLSGWHSNTVDDISFLAAYSNGLRQLNVSNWNMPELKHMECMCYYDEVLESLIGIDSWVNTRNISGMRLAFAYCYKLKGIDLSAWDVPGVVDCQSMFVSCWNITSIDLSGIVISGVTDLGSMFSGCSRLEYLDISGMDAAAATRMVYLFDGCTRLQTVVLGDKNPFQGTDVYYNLPTPPYNFEGKSYSGKWVREDGTMGPYTSDELRTNYDASFAGTWVWDQTGVTGYTIVFEAPEGTLGSMAPVRMPEANISYMLPANQFRRPGATFSYWRDNVKGYTYGDRSYVSGYAPGSVVVFKAVFSSDGGGSIEMEDGAFTFNLKGGQTAVFEGLPVDTVYQVYEDTPSGWALITQSGSSGMIESVSRSEAEFANQYVANQCSLILSGEKFFDDELSTDKQFQFELVDEDGNVVATAVNGEGGLIAFNSLTFTDADVGREIYYTVREVLPTSESSISTQVDEAYQYDAHEERIKVIVSYRVKGSGSVYTGTDNFDGDGNRLKSAVSVDDPLVKVGRSSNLNQDGTVIENRNQVVYSHTDNIDDAGVKQEDFENYKYYADIVTIPHATKLRVRLTYSNVRGAFYIWRGAHEGVYTRTYSSDFNTGTSNGGYHAYYYYRPNSDNRYLTDEMIIDGDSITMLYYSSTIAPDSSTYTELSNYGYYMEVTALEFDSNDYESGHNYSSLVTIPGATKLHVKVQYSNPRGEDGVFAIWDGAHVEVATGTWSDECNLDNTYRTFSGSNSSELLTQEFDIVGDSVSAFYRSTALSFDDPDYTLYSNYGYYMTVSAVEMTNYNSVRPDGSLISDYPNQQLYSDVVMIPGAEKLHVEVSYSTPRGYFYVWDGVHREVSEGTSGFNAEFNTNTALKTYSYSSADEGQLLTDSFDVDGNALSVMYYSVALASDVSIYNEYSNYGCLFKITPINLSGTASDYVIYSSTPNVGSDGVQHGNYTKGKDYVDVITIPGARYLIFSINFNMGSNDRLRLFEGNHPEYTYDTSANSVGWMTGSTSSPYTYGVGGDTATLIFHADANSTGGTGYGYLATVRSGTSLGELYAEAIYDEDRINFYNESGMGYLTLSKVSSDPAYSGGEFVFEVALVDERGNPYDYSEDVGYHVDTEVLPSNLLTVYHIGVNPDGSEYGVLYTEQYPKAAVGDTVRIESKAIDYFEYANNDYTNDGTSGFDCVIGDSPLTVCMYYNALPHLLRVKHVLLDANNKVVATQDVEDSYLYGGEEIVINPKHYNGYAYVENTYGLTGSSDLRGKTMPDTDIGIVLKYRVTRTVRFVNVDLDEARTYQLELSDDYTGLKTDRYGDIDFVDGVAELTLSGPGTVKSLVLPYKTKIQLKPGTNANLGYMRGYSGSIYDASVYTTPSSWSYTCQSSGQYIVEFHKAAARQISFRCIVVNAAGTQTQYGTYNYRMYAGDTIGNRNQTGTSVSYSSSWYTYTGQDVDASTVVGDTDLTVVQYYGIRRTVTVQHIIVTSSGTENVAYTSSFNTGAYGPFSVSLRNYYGYTFDSAVCSTDNSIVLSGTGPVTGTLKGDNITIQIRYRQN